MMNHTEPSSSAAGSDIIDSSDHKDFLIVGIGASAGGIQALKIFFEHVPHDSGMAYVVILHLSPDHESKLAEVLQVTATIPVTQVREKTHLKPNHVYVVPPNQSLTMQDGHITIAPIKTFEERRAPVDIFFRTLAESHHDRAVAVILSGTGADGSMGIKRIKERGGVAFVQHLREAEFSEMPRNSIATDLIDAVLPVADIPARIIAYQENLRTVVIPVEEEARPQEQQQALRDVFTLLRIRTGHDFSNYKRPTVLRRIERRININQLTDVSAYAGHLHEHPEETQSLLNDLLISVTNFFRDKEAFEALQQELVLRILNGKGAEDQVRIWVAGCATGEEAYSIAMLFAEGALELRNPPSVQIFASDISEDALAVAREGFYTLNDAADVSPERLRRFFTKEAEGFRIRRELREMVLFAHHNLIKDPPFSHLDLVTCRNLLIYLNHTAQERVMETLHFALNPGGYLFIGLSESVDGASDLYAPVNKEHHIFQSRHVSPRIAYPVPNLSPLPRFDQMNVAEKSSVQEARDLERISFGDLHQQLLEQYAPPSLVINEHHDIVHLSERAGRYLQIAGGAISHNLLNLIQPELRLELRTALYQSAQRQTNVEVKNLTFKSGDRAETINIYVRPVLRPDDTSRGFTLVIFEQTETSDAAEAMYSSHEPVSRQLEDELTRSKARLRSSTEQFEVQSEELKASNEELQAMNEELRSTAEEMETGKEELQSVNEELITVNQELKIKIEELSQSNNDFQNLMNSTDIGTIFLDRSLRVNLFTPAACDLFNLIPADFNRPLSDITNQLVDADLIHDAETALDKLSIVEREMRTTDGRVYLMRIFPYRTTEDKISGVVLTFINISERKRAEENLVQSEERYRIIINQATAGMAQSELDGSITLANQNLADITGYTIAELLNMRMQDLTHPEDTKRDLTLFEQLATEGASFQIEARYLRKDGSTGWARHHVTAIRDKDGIPRSAAFVIIDITERKQMEDELKRLNEHLEQRVIERTLELSDSNTALQAEIVERKQMETVRMLLRTLLTAQEQERRHLARELHDQFGQQLTALKMNLELLKESCGEQTELCERVDTVVSIAKRLDADVDFLVWQVRPTALDDLGLVAALTTYFNEWMKHQDVPVQFAQVGMEGERLSLEIETILYRIAQETLNNIAKHARAKQVSIILNRRNQNVTLIIEDDGIGFDVKQQEAADGQRFGLLGIRERAALVGGTVDIESQPGDGTTIFVRIPARNMRGGDEP